MRIPILLLVLIGASTCGDPVRRGDVYPGEALVRFSARLTGPPLGYQAGDSLMPGLQKPSGGGQSADGTDIFHPTAFPHDFSVGFWSPPLLGSPVINGVPNSEPGYAWHVRVTNQTLVDPRRQLGIAASVNHWIAYVEQAATLHPLGPDGPPVDLPAGFSLISRTCSPGQLNQFKVIPSDEVIVVEPLTQDTAENEYRMRCGAPLIPPRSRAPSNPP